MSAVTEGLFVVGLFAFQFGYDSILFLKFKKSYFHYYLLCTFCFICVLLCLFACCYHFQHVSVLLLLICYHFFNI